MHKLLLLFFVFFVTDAMAEELFFDKCERLFVESDSKAICRGNYRAYEKFSDEELQKIVTAEAITARDELAKVNATEARMVEAKRKLDGLANTRDLRVKGLYPGITLQEADSFHPGIADYCKPAAGHNDEPTQCRINVYGAWDGYEFRFLYSLAESEVQTWLFRVANGKIWDITALVRPEGATAIGQALAEKYKNAVISTPTVTNRMNAKFQNPTWTWRSGAMKLEVEKYSSSTEFGSLTFSSSKAPPLVAKPSTRNL